MTGTEEFCGITQSLKKLRTFTFVIVLSLATMYVLTAPAAIVQPASACGECTPSTCCEEYCSVECCYWSTYEYGCMTQCFICHNECSYCCS